MVQQNLKNKRQVFIRMSEEDRQILFKMSEESGIKLSQIIRTVISEFIKTGKRVKYIIE